jgi:hypothetical protein
MKLAKKLQLPSGTATFLINVPKGLKLDIEIAKKSDPKGALLLFANDSKSLEDLARPAIEAAKADRLSWIAYPKAGQLKTDLNRDRLVELMKPYGIEGVRLVSIDEIWSAMRFRPIHSQ